MLTVKDKKKLTDTVISILNSHMIVLDTDILDHSTCLTIVNELVSVIKNSADIGVYLKGTTADDRMVKILEIVMEVLSSEELDGKITPEVQEQLRNISQNAELTATVLTVVDGVNDAVLEHLDANLDGRVTVQEVEDKVISCLMCEKAGGCACYADDGCCKGCKKFSKDLGSITAKIFIKVFCCGCDKNYITR